jgi:hypothetical protein
VVKLGGLAGRLALVSVVAAGGMYVSASPASARVFVGADNPRAGATNVRIAFRAEARSRLSGIAFLRVTLPSGLDADDFRLLDGPAGWKLSSTPDGYNVGGPPTDVGEDAVYQVVIDRLPNVRRLAFPTLQQYSDGRIEKDNPTPVLALAPRRAAPSPPRTQPPRVEQPAEPPQIEQPPAAVPTTPPALELPSESPSVELPATTYPTSDPVALAANRGRTETWVWVALGAVVLLVAPIAVFAWSRWRRRARHVSI